MPWRARRRQRRTTAGVEGPHSSSLLLPLPFHFSLWLFEVVFCSHFGGGHRVRNGRTYTFVSTIYELRNEDKSHVVVSVYD
jgi:hypothetical protein